MGEILSIHSFRGGTGKSNLTANLATQYALRGFRVGIVDTDINSPGIHVLFGFDESTITRALNDFLWGKASIEQIAYPIHETSANSPERAFLRDTRIWLIPSSMRTSEIARVLREGYDVSLLNEGFHSLIDALSLDYLFIDTHPGLNEETLLSFSISDALIVILRPDEQDWQGTAVTVDIARKLEVASLNLVVNKALSRFDFRQVKNEIEAAFGAPVLGVLPLTEDVAANASRNIFSGTHPDHVWSQTIRSIVDQLLGG